MIVNTSSSATASPAASLPLQASCPQRSSARLPRALLCLILPLLPVIPSMAQGTRPASGSKTGQAAKAVESPINYAGIAYKSGSRRDPFLHPPKPQPGAGADTELSRGLPPPGIAGTYIAQASLEGISIRNERRTAVVRGADDRAYFLREGDRLFDGYLKTIQEDSITLVRETKMRSGKTLTQEVTKRLRTP